MSDEIIRMAREAGIGGISEHYGFVPFNTFGAKELERFAALVSAHEREACAKSVYDSTDWAHEERDMVLKEAIAAAIRAIKFEGDTGFRPVSEMIAEHKQDPKKAAAIEKAKMRKAEQKPVAWRVRGYNQFKTGNPAPWRYVDGADKPTVNKPDCCDFEPLYATPVRTKDLTDEEILKIVYKDYGHPMSSVDISRAAIAADREKNK